LKKRAILLLPEFDNIYEVQRIREQYDPLYRKIAPHITVVFPFESEISSNQILQLVEDTTKHCGRFALRMGGYTGYDNEYLFLNVVQGKDEIINLHQRLYSGVLKRYHESQYKFIPHMTVGRLSNEADFIEALKKIQKHDTIFQTQVTEENKVLKNLESFLLYCLILSIVLLVIVTVFTLSFGDLIYAIQSRFFEISKKEYEMAVYYFIAQIKILAFVFFLIPYISVRMLLSKFIAN